MQTIVVPTDFSIQAEWAADVAAQLAKKYNSKLHLIHVVDAPHRDEAAEQGKMPETPEGEYLLRLASQKFKTWLSMEKFEGLDLEHKIIFSNTYKTIVAYAKEADADVIIMGSKGATGARDWLIGSNAERVIRLAECPVLTIKEPHEDFAIEKITIASNFYGEFDYAYKQIKPLVDLFDAKIDLLKVITPGTFEASARSRKVMNKFAKDQELKDYTINTYNAFQVEEGIVAFCRHEKTDLLVMPTHGRKGLSHLIFGSTTEKIANQFHLPILSFAMQEEEVEYGVLFPS